MVELLKQPQYKPMSVVQQVMSIYAGTRGHLDRVPTNEVARWEEEFQQFMSDQRDEILQEITDKKSISDELATKIDAAIADFKQQFKSSSPS